MNPFILARSKEAQTQLAERDRRKNVRGAFLLNSVQSVRAKRMLLIDDVYTSGAAANECSRTLIRAGAKEVYLARAVV